MIPGNRDRPITGASDPRSEGGSPCRSSRCLNQKGGVGKTRTCHHLAGTLAADGAAASCSSTTTRNPASRRGSSGRPTGRARPGRDDRGGLPRGRAAARPGHPADAVRRRRPAPRVGGRDATTTSRGPTRPPWDDQVGLREFLAEAAGRLRPDLIDCPPNLHLCSWAALAASDFLIVPLQAEDYGSPGARPVRDSVAAVRAAINPRLALLGYLLTMYRPRAAIHQLYEGNLRAPTATTSSPRPCPTPSTSRRRSASGSRSRRTSRRAASAKASGRWPTRCWRGSTGRRRRGPRAGGRVMGKPEELTRAMGGNVGESIGVGRPAGADVPAMSPGQGMPDRMKGVARQGRPRHPRRPDHPRPGPAARGIRAGAPWSGSPRRSEAGRAPADPGPVGRGRGST